MGAPMAANLQQGSHQLFVHDRNPAPTGLIEKGATFCESGNAVAQQADIVILMVPDTPHVESVLFGENGVASGLRANQIVVDMSSISPIATKEFARKINELGCQYLDAPVSGGEVGAKAASLTIMVGGPQAVFDKVKPLFELMGGFAASRILEVHGERMIKRTFDPGFRIELHQKDLNLALQGARALGVSLPHTASAQELMNACAANGMSQLDHSALCRAIELLSRHEIANN
jgi:2-hydroxy-3-oxopropionate reductase